VPSNPYRELLIRNTKNKKMKKLKLIKTVSIFILLTLCATQIFAQASKTHKAVSLFDAQADKSTTAIGVQELTLRKADLQAVFAQKPAELNLSLPYKGENMVLHLTKVSILSHKNYMLVQTATGIDTLPYTGDAYYRGEIVGAQGKSMASVSVFDDQIMAVFSDNRGNFVLGESQKTTTADKSKPTEYVLYNANKIKNAPEIACHTTENAPDVLHDVLHDVANAVQSHAKSGQDTVRIYLEVNNDLRGAFNGTTTTVNYITSVFNAVATIYANEQIVLQLMPVFVWETQSPYLVGGIQETLDAFRAYRTSFDGEQAQLLTLNMGGGIASGFNTFCTERRYSYSGIETSFQAMPAYSWTIMVIAHEFGHCFGSRHTHWCGWQGGAIDACSGWLEPAPDGTTCSTTTIPTNGGTIMSYCNQNSVGINFANGFGQQPGDRIRQCVANRYCAPNSTTGGIDIHITNLPSEQEGFWSVDSGNFLLKYDVASNLSEGQHTVAFKDFGNGIGTPATQTVTVTRQQTTHVYAEYLYPSGWLKVNLTGGNGLGRWSVDNGVTWRGAGDSVLLRVDLQQMISFKTVAGFLDIGATSVYTSLTQTTVISAAYQRATYGFLRVNITGANGQGQWSPDNGVHWVNGGDSLHLPIYAGSYYNISFKNVDEWITPSLLYYSPVLNTLETLNAQYEAVGYGRLKVNLTGANGLGQWSVDNINWRNSGDTLRLPNYPSSYYNIYYKTVAEWIVPSQNTCMITVNQQTTIEGVYTAIEYGILKINLTGGNGQGRWSVDFGQTWYNSGDSLRVPTYPNPYYTVYYKDVQGWITPQLVSNTIVTNTTTTLQGIYQLAGEGYIKVNLTGANGNGQWSADYGQTWRNSGDSVLVTNVYNTTIYYKNVTGWYSPTAATVWAIANQTITVNAEYTPIPRGVLKVVIWGGNTQGRWTIDNINWHIGSDTLHLFENTSYNVSYKDVSGWITPTSTYCTITANQATLVRGQYFVIRYGYLQVDLDGANGQGRWSLDNGTTWRNSGDTLRLPTHLSHYITFKDVPEWFKPNSEYVNVSTNMTTAYRGTYTPVLYDNLTVNLVGADGNGQWSIDNTNWHNSGETLRLGNDINYYYIYFKNVAGWQAPYQMAFYVTGNQNQTVTGIYTAAPSTLLVVNLVGSDGKGRFRLEYDTLWHESGDTVVLYTNGYYRLIYKDVVGWNSPYSDYAYYNWGANVSVMNAVYQQQPFSTLRVHLTGGEQEAAWSINNGVTWQKSDDTLHLFSTERVYFTFKNVKYWGAPAEGLYNVYRDGVSNFFFAYTLPITAPGISAAIFPNPAVNTLNCIVSTPDESKNVLCRLFNTLGENIEERTIAANTKETFDVSGLPAGVYALHIVDTQSKSTIVKKIVVQRKQ
jgi:Metallo-peptidase family M12/Secretion system C-terminal sorting domain